MKQGQENRRFSMKYLLNENFWKWGNGFHKYIAIDHRNEDMRRGFVLQVPRGHNFLRALYFPSFCPLGGPEPHCASYLCPGGEIFTCLFCPKQKGYCRKSNLR